MAGKCLSYLWTGGDAVKSRLMTTATLLVMAALLAASRQSAAAVAQGLRLCAETVVPALFPFLVLSSLLVELGGLAFLAPPLQRLLGRLFGCSATGTGVFLLSLAGGYPMGPRLIAQLYATGQLSRQEAEHLLLFCNNAGPAFILGLVGLGRFGSLRTGLALWVIHMISAGLVALLLRPRQPFSAPELPPPQTPFAQALVHAIGAAGSTTVQLCAFVTFFCTLLQLAADRTGIAHPLVLGFVELTQGTLTLSATPTGFVMASALLGWGGLSVHCQSAAVLAGTELSLRHYLPGKLLHSILSSLFAAISLIFLF